MIDLKGGLGGALSSAAGGLVGKAMGELGIAGGGLAGQLMKSAGGAGMKAVNGAIFGSGRQDPDVQFSFYVEINGIQTVKFRECNGIEWSVATESFHEGGNNRNKVHLVGQASFKPLILKKGFYATNGEFYAWLRMQQQSGTAVGRTNIALVVTNEAADEVCRFHFYNAFCSRYQGPSFNAKQSEIAFEEIEVVYDWFELLPGDGFSAVAASAGMAAM